EAEVPALRPPPPAAAPRGLHRLAPPVAVTLSDPGFALQVSRQAGLSPQAVGPDGRPVAEELTHSLRGGPVEPDLVTIEGPELKVPAAEAVARLRAAEEGRADLSAPDPS